MSGICKRPVLRHLRNVIELVEDYLAEEQCLTIHLDGQERGRTMCTPGHDIQLVMGYLYTERVIESLDDVGRIDFYETRKGYIDANILLSKKVSDRLPRTKAATLPRLWLQAERIFTFMQRMESAQAVFQRTGATHSAAIFDKSGNLLGLAEDIGRHNALDKVIGMALQNGTLRRAAVATMTSRLSCELVNKAAAAGLTFLCGISVATNLAVELAEKHEITLVGRVRGGRMNIYTHRERIIHEPFDTADQAHQRISA